MSWPWEYFQQCMIWMGDQKICTDQTIEYALQNFAITSIIVIVDLLLVAFVQEFLRQARRRETTE